MSARNVVGLTEVEEEDIRELIVPQEENIEEMLEEFDEEEEEEKEEKKEEDEERRCLVLLNKPRRQALKGNYLKRETAVPEFTPRHIIDRKRLLLFASPSPLPLLPPHPPPDGYGCP